VSARQVIPPGERRPARRPHVVAAQLLGVWVLLLGLMLGIGSLLSRVERGSTVEQVDAGVPTWLASRRTDALDAVSGVAAELGNTTVVLVLAVLASAVAAFVWRGWRPVAVIAVALVGEVTIFLMTSAVIDRQRPPVSHLDDQLPPTSSFPSGHTAAAICLYGAVAALVLAATHGRRRYAVVGGAALLVLVVALARLYRGAHYPTDVLGSVLFALPWLLLVVRLLSPSSPDPGPSARSTRTG
jgi:membrane-associated phospholipid phosphatase